MESQIKPYMEEGIEEVDLSQSKPQFLPRVSKWHEKEEVIIAMEIPRSYLLRKKIQGDLLLFAILEILIFIVLFVILELVIMSFHILFTENWD